MEEGEEGATRLAGTVPTRKKWGMVGVVVEEEVLRAGGAAGAWPWGAAGAGLAGGGGGGASGEEEGGARPWEASPWSSSRLCLMAWEAVPMVSG